MGVSPGTSQYMAMKSDGVYSCRNIRRLVSDQAYDPARLQDVNTRYRAYMIEGAWSAPVGVVPRPPPWSIRAQRKSQQFRGLSVARFTIGCPGSEQLQINSEKRKKHSEACRARMEEETAQTDDGREQLARAKDRLDERAAQMG